MKASTLVRRARKKAGLSQRELAARARVPQSTIGRIEADAIDPRSSTLFRILAACGLEVEAQPRLGEGIDRSQLREFLALTPRQRIDSAATAARNVRRLTKAAKRGR